MADPNEPRLPFEKADEVGPTASSLTQQVAAVTAPAAKRWVAPALASPPAQPEAPAVAAAAKATITTEAVVEAAWVADVVAHSPVPPRTWALVGLVLLLASVAVPVVSQWRAAAVAPTAEALQAAAVLVGKGLQAGDGLAFVPAWSAHQPQLFVAQWRQHNLDFAGALVLGEPLQLWDCDGKARMWVVSTHDQLALAQLPGAKELRREALGHGTGVALFELPKSRVVYDFRKNLKLADHAIFRAGAPADTWQHCPWKDNADPNYDGGLHDCGSQDWKNTWATLHEVGNTRREGIFVHPPFEDGVLRLTYKDLPPGLFVAGRFGNRLWAVRHGDDGAPVTLRVLAGERVIFEKKVQTNDFGWHAFEARLTSPEVGGPISFEIAGTKDAWREAVLDARLLAAP